MNKILRIVGFFYRVKLILATHQRETGIHSLRCPSKLTLYSQLKIDTLIRPSEMIPE
jgi:hypothetical protein